MPTRCKSASPFSLASEPLAFQFAGAPPPTRSDVHNEASEIGKGPVSEPTSEFVSSMPEGGTSATDISPPTTPCPALPPRIRPQMELQFLTSFDIAIDPANTTQNFSVTRSARRPASRMEIAGAIYDWVACLFVAVMVGSQFFGVISSSVDSVLSTEIGRDPALGPYDTQKTNDVPYTDRVLACTIKGVGFTPTLVSDLLETPTSYVNIVDTTGVSISGYRLVERHGAKLDSVAFDFYQHVCKTASSTLNGIVSACESLGYNVSTDGLRVVNGVDSNETVLISNALPILVMPYWDNAPNARYVLPGLDGSACIVRLAGKYLRVTSSVPQIRGLNRSAREGATVELLQQPNGQWRNGWYEDLQGMKWYSDVFVYKMSWRGLPTIRRFDGALGPELNCTQANACESELQVSRWGPHFTIETTILRSTSLVIYNGTQFGIFWYRSDASISLTSDYTWEMALSNVSIALLIFRWMISLVALHRGYLDGKCALHHTGIGALSNSTSFKNLPLTLLPRLATTLTAFFSVGCSFQGQQLAFVETWFVMYPSITELTLLYYSLLNTLAKVLRRRVTDALFAPTIIALNALHWSRQEIARSSWMNLAEGFVSTLVTSDEMKQLRLQDFFTTDVALRLNGQATTLFVLKLAILGVSLVPLLLSRPLPVQKHIAASLKGVEKVLATRASNVAGLGRSPVYEIQRDGSLIADARKNIVFFAKRDRVRPDGLLAFNSYELVRLGYVVYGDKYLISMDDWDRVSMLAGFRHCYHLWNHRVVLFELQASAALSSLVEVNENPVLVRIDAPEVLRIPMWAISSRAINC